MLRLFKTVMCLSVLLVHGAVPLLAQQQPVSEVPTLTAYRLPSTLDAKITEDVIKDLLSGHEGVRVALDQATGNLVVAATRNDHLTIANTLAILEKPVPVGERGDSANRSQTGSYLRVYAVDGSITKMAYGVVESLLAGKDGVRLAMDSTTNKLIVMAANPEHQSVASALSELAKNFPNSEKATSSIDDPRVFSIHALGNTLVLLNSHTGDSWILSDTKNAESKAWTLINRDR